MVALLEHVTKKFPITYLNVFGGLEEVRLLGPGPVAKTNGGGCYILKLSCSLRITKMPFIICQETGLES